MNRHFSSVLAPGAMLVVAIAPGFTIGLVRPSIRSSIAATELNLLPVALRPTNCATVLGLCTLHISANTNGLATLMIENSMSASPAVAVRPWVFATQIPNLSGSTVARDGYTCDNSPSVLSMKRSYASFTRSLTRSDGGRCPVETYGAPTTGFMSRGSSHLLRDHSRQQSDTERKLEIRYAGDRR
jgi:hypothetical protein